MNKSRTFLLLAALLVPLTFWGQACDDPVVDRASLLSSQDRSQIAQSLGKLRDEGVEGIVWIEPSMVGYDDLAALKESLKSRCPSWKGPSGKLKSNTVLFLYSRLSNTKKTPNYGSVAIYGPASGYLSKVIDENAGRIISNFMASPLRERDWSRAFTAGIGQTVVLIKQAKAPAPSGPVVNDYHQEAPHKDYSGVIYSLLLMAALACGLWLFLFLRRKKQEEREDVSKAKQGAVIACNGAKVLLYRLKDMIATAEASGNKLPTYGISQALSAESLYDSLVGSERTDPATPGLSAVEYNAIRDQYAEVTRQLHVAEKTLNLSSGSPPPSPPAPDADATSAPQPPTEEEVRQKRKKAHGTEVPYEEYSSRAGRHARPSYAAEEDLPGQVVAYPVPVIVTSPITETAWPTPSREETYQDRSSYERPVQEAVEDAGTSFNLSSSSSEERSEPDTSTDLSDSSSFFSSDSGSDSGSGTDL